MEIKIYGRTDRVSYVVCPACGEEIIFGQVKVQNGVISHYSMHFCLWEVAAKVMYRLNKKGRIIPKPTERQVARYGGAR